MLGEGSWLCPASQICNFWAHAPKKGPSGATADQPHGYTGKTNIVWGAGRQVVHRSWLLWTKWVCVCSWACFCQYLARSRWCLHQTKASCDLVIWLFRGGFWPHELFFPGSKNLLRNFCMWTFVFYLLPPLELVVWCWCFGFFLICRGLIWYPTRTWAPWRLWNLLVSYREVSRKQVLVLLVAVPQPSIQ